MHPIRFLASTKPTRVHDANMEAAVGALAVILIDRGRGARSRHLQACIFESEPPPAASIFCLCAEI